MPVFNNRVHVAPKHLGGVGTTSSGSALSPSGRCTLPSYNL